MRVKAKWLGREAVVRKLNDLLPDAEPQIALAQLEAAQELADAIRPRAPVRTGEYRASIQGDRLANRPGKNAIGQGLKGSTKDKNATGIFAKFTWRWLEFGTVKMPARPHIFPSYRARRKAIRRKIAGAVNKAVRKAKR